MDFALRMNGITQTFPGVVALDDVDFAVRRNEIHALIGENGAGNSTLVKIMSGVLAQEAGEIEFNGQSVNMTNPQHAQNLGISTLFQDLHLFPELSVAENILMGREPKTRGAMIDWRELHRKAAELLQEIDIDIDTKIFVRQLSIAQKQMVMVARALSQNASLIIMDEPTATLTSVEIENLFVLIRTLKENGTTVIFISHKLDEIFEITDRITILRDGKNVGELDTNGTSTDEVIRLMVGRTLEEEFPVRISDTGPEIISVRDMSTTQGVKNAFLNIHAGEVVGLFGLVGAGRTEVARAIFGIDRIESGQINMSGEPLHIKSPTEAIARGIAFATEDRKHQGLVLGMSVKENITLPNMKAITTFNFIRHHAEDTLVDEYIGRLNIKTPGMDQETQNLSGGNQQKVVIARWLCAKPKLLILDEPTQGIDVGAKREIYLLINELVSDGMAILLISSEIPEILGMSDRVYIMHRGRITGEFGKQDFNPENILACAAGIT